MTRTRLVAACVAALLLAAGVALVLARRTTPLDAALVVLDDDAEFTRATDAGAALTKVSLHLERSAEECGTDARCADRFAAAAAARVGAVAVLRCGRPEIHAFREELTRHVRALADARPSPLPRTPFC